MHRIVAAAVASGMLALFVPVATFAQIPADPGRVCQEARGSELAREGVALQPQALDHSGPVQGQMSPRTPARAAVRLPVLRQVTLASN